MNQVKGSSAPSAEPEEREKFEKWAKPLFFSFLLRALRDTDEYDSLTTQAAWMAWQASRAAATQGAPTPAPSGWRTSADGLSRTKIAPDAAAPMVPSESTPLRMSADGRLKPWQKTSWTCARARVDRDGMHCPDDKCADCPNLAAGIQPTPEQTFHCADPQRQREIAEERAARAIYEGWKDAPGWVPWVEGGNSYKQDEARRLARAAVIQGDGKREAAQGEVAPCASTLAGCPPDCGPHNRCVAQGEDGKDGVALLNTEQGKAHD